MKLIIMLILIAGSGGGIIHNPGVPTGAGPVGDGPQQAPPTKTA